MSPELLCFSILFIGTFIVFDEKVPLRRMGGNVDSDNNKYLRTK